MHVEVVITGLELIELIRCQRDRGGPDTAAGFAFCHREYHRAGDAACADVDVRLRAVDICSDDRRFHLVRRGIHAHDAGTAAIAGDTGNFFSARQRAGKHILRYLTVDGADLTDLGSSRADRVVIAAAARQHQQ